jgi:translation initiation factor IF-2
VRGGYECGAGISNFNDVKVGDVLECFKIEKTAALETVAAGDRGGARDAAEVRRG